jgi:hypothetical protein
VEGGLCDSCRLLGKEHSGRLETCEVLRSWRMRLQQSPRFHSGTNCKTRLIAWCFPASPSLKPVIRTRSIAGRNRGLILGWATPDATAAGMAITPTARRCGHCTPGKDGSDRHALRLGRGVFCLLWSGFRTRATRLVCSDCLEYSQSAGLDRFPGEWDVGAYPNVAASDSTVGIPNKQRFDSRLLEIPGAAGTKWEDEFNWPRVGRIGGRLGTLVLSSFPGN